MSFPWTAIRQVDWLSGFLRFLTACNHSRTPAREGKCYCPDCGQGVIFQWVVIRCADCGIRRPGRYFLRQVVADTHCCLQCGQSAYTLEYLENPQFYQLRYARLLAQSESDYLDTQWQRLRSTLRTFVWMDRKSPANPRWLLTAG